MCHKGYIMELKKCKTCLDLLTSENICRGGFRNGKQRFRAHCKKCVARNYINSTTFEQRQLKWIKYSRAAGVVRQYPCETCSALCYKKYARAFCSDKCRFMSYVDKQEEGCWVWTGGINTRGYGKFSFRKKKAAIASRVSYELFVGPISDNLFICHTCDNPPCVNPDHLFMGTNQDNQIDYIKKNPPTKRKNCIKCLNLLTASNLLKNGWRNGVQRYKPNCKTCN